MTVKIPAGLGNGTYSLLWRTLSTVDGHTAQGYLPFTIGTEADVRIVAPPAVDRQLRRTAGVDAGGRALAGLAGDGGGGRRLAGLALRRAPGDLPRVATGTETDATRAAVRDRRVRLFPAGQRRGAGGAGGSHLRTWRISATV